MQLLMENIGVRPVPLLPSYLRFVPVFSLCDVLGSDGLVLHADVPQSRSQVGLGHVHLDLDLSVLHLALQLTDFLKGDEKIKEKI